MRDKNLSIGRAAVLAILIVTLLVTGPGAAAQTEKVLHSFGHGKDGSEPYSSLIFDAEGNLYGTTSIGGAYNYGTVFELTPEAGGGWAEKVLLSFNDWSDPEGGLIFDAAGNLYGTTTGGGPGLNCGDTGCGTVFELMPQASGDWTRSVLHSFTNNGKDGTQPNAGLIFDAFGNLYGTTAQGGNNSAAGTVFELSPKEGDGWTEKVLHRFCSQPNCADGVLPSGLVLDTSGNLYGATYSGGANELGTVFELSPQAGGGWNEKVLRSFCTRPNCTDGAGPFASMILDASGNLYGTTDSGGANDAGTAFELSPKAGGGWTEKVLHSFTDNGTDGTAPTAGLTPDVLGNLYGTTHTGGAYNSGTLFELKPGAGEIWTETVLHSFGSGTDGKIPAANLIFDADGNLYGTTIGGGENGEGTVFEITP